MKIRSFKEFLNEKEESLSKQIEELEKKIWDSKKGLAKLEWEEISQKYLDGEGKEAWTDLDDVTLSNAIKEIKTLIDKHKL